ncbi:MAG TPA: hypothetical protein VM597_06730, partial [Gemmataceae bacterium]|nr:hypothetical protein [Gemmataceae bacterium]
MKSLTKSIWAQFLRVVAWRLRFTARLRRLTRRAMSRARVYRPGLLAFEERVNPVTNTWTGGAGNLLWSALGNWSLNHVPTSTEDVVIPDLGVAGVVDVTLDYANINTTVASITTAERIGINTAGVLTSNGNLAGTGELRVQGGTFNFAGTNWNQTAAINVASGTLNLGGTFSGSAIGTWTRTGGTVNLTGTVSGGTLTLSDATGSWNMQGGTLQNVTYEVAEGSSARLVATNSSGFLNNVTLASPMDLRTGALYVSTGLTLQNVTQPIGDPTGATAFNLRFAPITVGGTGTFVFGASNYNLIDQGLAGGTALTFGPNITFRGHSGSITTGGVDTLNIQGTVQADVAGGTISLASFPHVGVYARVLNTSGALRTLNGGSLVVRQQDPLNPWTNSAPIDLSGGSLTVTNTSWTNTAPITATNATLNIGGIIGSASLSNVTTSGGAVSINSNLNLAGGTLTVDGTNGAVWTLAAGVTISNGTIAAVNGGTLRLAHTAVLDNITIAAGATVATTAGATFTLRNNLTVNGTLQIGDAAGVGAGGMAMDGSQTIGGSGAIVFGGSTGNTIYQNVYSGTTVTFGPDLTIRGKNGLIQGTATNDSGSTTYFNQGRIRADVPGGTIHILPGRGTLSFTNQATGTIQADAGAAVLIQPGSFGALSWSNAGLLNLPGGTFHWGGTFPTASVNAPGRFTRSGGTVNITGTLNNSGSTLTLDAATTGVWNLAGGRILGGTVVNPVAANLNVAINNTNTFDGITIPAGSTIDVGATANAYLNVANGLTVDGTLLLGRTDGTAAATVAYTTTQTLGGSGSIVFGGSTSNAMFLNGNHTVTVGPTLVIRGKSGNIYGTLNNDSGSGAYVNQGRIEADVAGGVVNIAPGRGLLSFTNTATGTVLAGPGVVGFNAPATPGALSWSNAGLLSLQGGTFHWGGSFSTASVNAPGRFTRSGGTVNITGTLNNSSSTLTLDTATTGAWNLNGGRIAGGTIVNPTAANLNVTPTNGSAFDGVTIAAGSTVDIVGAVVNVFSGLTVNGTLRVGDAAGVAAGGLSLQGALTIGGTGAIVFGGSTGNAISQFNYSGGVVTFGPDLTIRGKNGQIQGTAGHDSGSAAYINQGRIEADVAGGTITVLPVRGVLSFTNQAAGRIRVDSGATLTITPTSGSSAGTITNTGGTLNLGANFSVAVGGITNTGGTTNFAGILN